MSTDLKADRNFDDLATRFTKTIYDSPRGRLRLRALQQDFNDLSLPNNNAKVLDIGGGQGQFSLWLAQQGADISLCDISSEMLALAQAEFKQHGFSLNSQHCALQDVDEFFPDAFDLVLNHAVLEWLEKPLEALPILASKVKSGGWLSLMFYNLHGHVWRQVMNGRTHDPLGSNARLRQEGNAPQHPLDPSKVEESLNQLGFEVKRWRGIRCIHDPMNQKIRDRIGEEKVALADLEYGLIEPYRQFGRYVHFLAYKG